MLRVLLFIGEYLSVYPPDKFCIRYPGPAVVPHRHDIKEANGANDRNIAYVSLARSGPGKGLGIRYST